jgi:hypothetical protein
MAGRLNAETITFDGYADTAAWTAAGQDGWVFTGSSYWLDVDPVNSSNKVLVFYEGSSGATISASKEFTPMNMGNISYDVYDNDLSPSLYDVVFTNNNTNVLIIRNFVYIPRIDVYFNGTWTQGVVTTNYTGKWRHITVDFAGDALKIMDGTSVIYSQAIAPGSITVNKMRIESTPDPGCKMYSYFDNIKFLRPSVELMTFEGYADTAAWTAAGQNGWAFTGDSYWLGGDPDNSNNKVLVFCDGSSGAAISAVKQFTTMSLGKISYDVYDNDFSPALYDVVLANDGITVLILRSYIYIPRIDVYFNGEWREGVIVDSYIGKWRHITVDFTGDTLKIMDGTSVIYSQSITPGSFAVNSMRIESTPNPGCKFYSFFDNIQLAPKPVTEAPVFSSGKYISGPTDITISSVPGAEIYYTLNGGTPTTGSTRYTTAVAVNDGDTLQAIAVGTDVSYVTSVTFDYNPARVELTRGDYLLIEKGLQIQGMVFPVKEDNQQVTGLNLSQYFSAHFTTVNVWWNYNGMSYLGNPSSGTPWGRVASGYLTFTEMPYLNNLVSLQYRDEQDIANSENLTMAKTWMDYVKENYPDVLAYTNQGGSQNTVAQMQNYMTTVQPDLVMFDTYPFNGSLKGGSPTTLYGNMQKYRLLGLAGNDGTGNAPIPYALFTQTYVRSGHTPSESEIRLNNFSAWAFGYKFVTAFIYDSSDSQRTYPSIMFSGIDDNSPTVQFGQVAEANRQSLNLGSALVRLFSTDVRMAMGQYWGKENWWESNHTIDNPLPSGMSAWAAGAGNDAYITGISATNLGSKNNGKRGDVIIGFFKPLHESFDGDVYNNQEYFMVVNGLSDGSGTATQTQQRIRLTFNMGSNGIMSLQRLSRDSGTIEIVPLISDGNGGYYLDLTLDGGTGDLFKYNTGAPFVGIDQVDRPSLIVSPETQTVAKEAGTASFGVSNGGTGTIAWTAEVTSGNSWLTITSGQTGNESGSIMVSFTKNPVAATPRTATIRIASEGAAGSPRTITVVQSAPDLIAGDANKDCAVDVGDLGILAANYGTASGATWEKGDFNDDGAVDVGDLGILAAHYGEGSSSSLNFSSDYAKAFGTTTTDDSSDDISSTMCSSLGLPLIAGLALMGLMLVKLED